MTTKLTLSIRPEMIEKAKRISRQKGKSISKMVDEFFERLHENRTEAKEKWQGWML